jgi:hypothetical protein
MKGIDKATRDLPFKLAQISRPARNYLKILAVSLIQYHRDLPAREMEVFPIDRDWVNAYEEEGSGHENSLL